MRFPYEYSYFVFDFCLIKKNVCEKAKESERVEGESKGTREGGGETRVRGVWVRSAARLTSENE